MSNIIHELTGKKYLLVDFPVFSTTNKEKVKFACEKYGCIMQGMEFRGGFLTPRHGIMKILVPEEHALSFDRET